MNRLALVASLVIAVYGWAVAGAEARQGTALSKVASQLGFRYSYLGPEDAVTLARPGVIILVRPGERLFDVNDETEAMDGPVPYFAENDVYVSDQFIARLKAIALKYPASNGEGEQASVVIDKNAVRLPARASGAVTVLSIAQEPGSYNLLVDGKAPANLPITITLVATFSSVIPDTVLSRTRTSTDADGTFHADISAAPDYFTGSIISVVASSVPGIVTKKAQIVMQAPNAKVIVPADQIPHHARSY